MSDGFYRAPCKTCQGLFMPRDEKNVFCCRECAHDYHHLGRIMERQQIREQLRRAVEILNGPVNPPISLPMNPSANGGLKLTHPVLATESPGLVPEGVSQSA